MARSISKLSARFVETVETPGRHGDGSGLWLVVSKSGARSWAFMYRWQGKLTEMGLGSAARGHVSLARARELASAARAQIADGINPLEARRQAMADAAREKLVIPDFGTFALGLVDAIEGGFRNPKHREQWRSTLRTYCKPIWKAPINEVDTVGVLKCLQPIWLLKPETASRVRGRIERVLDAAKAQGLRSGENPAAWRGHLSSTLPKPQKLTRGHHRALPFELLPAFVQDLRTRDAIAARALEFAILTASRSGEVLKMTWAEIDFAKALWVVPGSRMKAGREHRVPLPPQALDVLESMSAVRLNDFVFPGARAAKPLSTNAFDMLLRRMERADLTAHGCRSSFSDWASEATSFSAETREACLAHTIKNKAEAAYRRGDQLEKRRQMLVAWAGFLDGEHSADNVVTFAKAAQ